MKSLITAVALLASSALAAKYAAGTNCHSNIECENNCLDRQYTIVNEDGGYIFACDPGVADSTQWYSAECWTTEEADRFSERSDEKATQAACEAVGGTFCTIHCVMSGKRVADEETRKSFRSACKTDAEPYIRVEKDEKAAKKYC